MFNNINFDFILFHFIPAVIFILGWTVVILMVVCTVDDIRDGMKDEMEEQIEK